MKNILVIFINSLLIISCDVQTNILVANNQHEALVEVYYNIEHFSYFFEKQKNINFLNTIQSRNHNLKFIKCDTINNKLSFSFKLLKNDTLYIDKSRGSNPNYSTIDSITILKYNAKKIKLQLENYDDNFKNYDNIWIYDIN